MNAIVKSLSALALGMVLAGGMAATAQPGPGGGPGFGMHRPPLERLLGPGGMGRWWNNPTVIDQLKLTEQQRKDMDQILLNHREKLIDMRAGVEKAELAMDPLVNADQPNEQAILAQIDKIAQARAELEKANARFLLALRAKLTPEQFKELKNLREQRGMRRWRDRGGPPGPGPQGNPGGPGAPSGPQSNPGTAPQGGPGADAPPPGPGDPQSMLLPPNSEMGSESGTVE